MSSFFKKLKGLTDFEEPAEEPEEEIEIKPEEESFSEKPKPEEPKKIEQPKKKERKLKKLVVKEDKSSFSPFATARVVEEKPAEPPKIVQKIEPLEKVAEEKPKVQEKHEERKWPEQEGQLAVDVYQTDGELVIQAAIAGIKPEDLDISAQGDTVTIRGKRENAEKEQKNYFYQECYWGAFSREIILPLEADSSRSEATMIDGILTIRMPKIEKEKKKKINIKM